MHPRASQAHPSSSSHAAYHHQQHHQHHHQANHDLVEEDDFVIVDHHRAAPVLPPRIAPANAGSVRSHASPKMADPFRRSSSFRRIGTVKNLSFPLLLRCRVEGPAPPESGLLSVNGGAGGVGGHRRHRFQPPPETQFDYDFATEEEIVVMAQSRREAERASNERMAEAQRVYAAEAESRRLAEQLRAEREAARAKELREAEEAAQRASRLLEQEREAVRARVLALQGEASPGGFAEAPAQLTDEQSNAVKTFMGITSVAAFAQARVLCEKCNWDVNQAVQAFFDAGSIEAAVQQREAAGAASPAPNGPGAVAAAHRAQIDIVLPNGVRQSQSFAYTDTLWTVYATVQSQSGSWGNKPIYLVRSIPRHQFSESEMDQTLEQAGLTPGGSLQAIISG